MEHGEAPARRRWHEAAQEARMMAARRLTMLMSGQPQI
jgi:hypothetical protein